MYSIKKQLLVDIDKGPIGYEIFWLSMSKVWSVSGNLHSEIFLTETCSLFKQNINKKQNTGD